ncbi:CHASE2 domain-containing protein [Dolichospermum sp. LEGE 00240]|nr:CHASE2 domain-containing protein [Dolichospermum sp. LEGE 00240]
MNFTAFYLTIQQVEQVCSFQLSWGQGQNLSVNVAYPENLTMLYQEWQKIYLSFYNTALRGKVANMGSLAAPPIDWHARLVQAEAQFLSVFHNWLHSAELFDIRKQIAQVSKQNQTRYLDIFIACITPDLAKLPWEVWEIGTEFALDYIQIRIVRTATNRRETVINTQGKYPSKARILVILGDDTGLNFESEKQAIASLKDYADVKFIGWQSNKNIDYLKTEIVQTISSQNGWDILFFAGHSNQTNLTGGELGIAPGVALSISELEPALITAKDRGLQCAIFNSCNGLSIADKLIDLGISQVAVMREPIHNQVAEVFLPRFLQALSEYKDVHESLISAAQYLKVEKNFTYPSAYLIPSLFRHPGAELFRLQPAFMDEGIKKLIPNRREIIVLSVLLIISLLLPVQQFLLQRRVLLQAIYRQLTGQVATVATPPVLLVEIDEDSIRKAKISNPKPIERKYLANLIDKLTANQAKIIGIDYLLDRHQGESDRILANSIKTAVKSAKPTLFVFAGTANQDGQWLRVLPNIANLNWSLEGEIEILPGYMQLLPDHNSQYNNSQSSDPDFSKLLNPGATSISSFSGLLTLGYQLQQSSDAPQPKLDSQEDFFQQINNSPDRKVQDRSHSQTITRFSYSLHQMWMHPIIDFSISPQSVYQNIPAWQLLENQNIPKNLQNLQDIIVIIAPGGYEEAGLNYDGEDNFLISKFPAIKYWRDQENPINKSQVLTGGEYHAYMIHHLLTKRLVIPIPDFWMIGVAILIGKSLNLYLLYLVPRKKSNQPQSLILVTIITGIYGLISLQVYISATAILLPWLLPSVTLWFYILSAILEKKSDE